MGKRGAENNLNPQVSTSIVFAQVVQQPIFTCSVNRHALSSVRLDSDDQLTIFTVISDINKGIEHLFGNKKFVSGGDAFYRTTQVVDTIEDCMERHKHNIASMNMEGHNMLTQAVDHVTDVLEQQVTPKFDKIEINIPPRDDNIGGARVEDICPDRPSGPHQGGPGSLAAHQDEPIDQDAIRDSASDTVNVDQAEGFIGPANG